MQNARFWLKSNVCVVPVVAGWYAWPLLIPPHTLARYVANHYVKILESYLADPSAHENALQIARFKGGPFVNRPPRDFDAISNWYETIKPKLTPLLQLSADIDFLETELLPTLEGQPVHTVYPKLPDSLKSKVEIFYDRMNQPSYRFIEPLMYTSSFYDTSLQCLKMSYIEEDYRDFALSTPQLHYEANELILHVDFISPLCNRLFAGGLSEEELLELANAMGIREQFWMFKDFFTDVKPVSKKSLKSNSIYYLGHASLLMKAEQEIVLLDPVLSYGGYENTVDLDRMTFDDLPETIDYVLITHNHQDHILLETLLRIRHKVKHIVVPKSTSNTLEDPSLYYVLKQLGFHHIIELGEFHSIQGREIAITGLPFIGEHGDLANRSKLAYSVRINGKNIVCAADSTNELPGLYQAIKPLVGHVDVVFIGMECQGAPVSWLYGPLFTTPIDRKHDQLRRLKGSDSMQGIEIIDSLDVQEVYVYAMGQEPWLGNVMYIKYNEKSPPIVESDKLIAYVNNKGGIAKRLYICEEVAI